MSTNFTLRVKHTGTETGNFCIYQTNEKQYENIHSLVWFSKYVLPNTDLEFKWELQYGFTWSEQGLLVPEVIYSATQEVNTDPFDISRNSIGFTRKDNAFKFTETDEPTMRGRLGFSCDETIPPKSASIGVSISGKPAFAWTASPNIKYTFRPHPRYWIAFGRCEEGEVIGSGFMTKKFEIVFRENAYEKTIRLTETNTWVDESK